MIELVRYYTPLDKGTFGRLLVAGMEFYTVELPWKNNRVRVSAIPEGLYGLERCMFYGGDGVGGRADYLTYEVLRVYGRTEIKLHRANTAAELQGCIAIGDALDVVNGRWAVLNSTEAHERFMRVMDGRQRDSIRIYQYRL